MLISLADAAKLLAALDRLERIENTVTSIQTDMATFKDTIIAAFAYAKARIAELEAENAFLAADDEADDAAVAAAAEEAAAAKAALAEAIAKDEAEDAEILEAAAEFIKPAEEETEEETEEEPVVEEPTEEEPVVEEPVVENL